MSHLLRIYVSVWRINVRACAIKIFIFSKFSITLEGNKIDPIVNAALKIIAKTFRTKIINMVDQEFSKVVQGFVEEINGKIPSPDRMFDLYPIFSLV